MPECPWHPIKMADFVPFDMTMDYGTALGAFFSTTGIFQVPDWMNRGGFDE
jgi:hypothetical protein